MQHFSKTSFFSLLLYVLEIEEPHFDYFKLSIQHLAFNILLSISSYLLSQIRFISIFLITETLKIHLSLVNFFNCCNVCKIQKFWNTIFFFHLVEHYQELLLWLSPIFFLILFAYTKILIFGLEKYLIISLIVLYLGLSFYSLGSNLLSNWALIPFPPVISFCCLIRNIFWYHPLQNFPHF